MVLKGDYQGTLSAQALLLRGRVVSVLLHGVNVWGQPLPYFAIGAKFEIWWRIVRSCCALFLTQFRLLAGNAFFHTHGTAFMWWRSGRSLCPVSIQIVVC